MVVMVTGEVYGEGAAQAVSILGLRLGPLDEIEGLWSSGVVHGEGAAQAVGVLGLRLVSLRFPFCRSSTLLCVLAACAPVGWWRVCYSSAWHLVGEASCCPSQVAYDVFLHLSERLKVAAPSCVGSSALSQARAYLFLGAGVESSMAPAESELQQLPPCLLRSRHLFSSSLLGPIDTTQISRYVSTRSLRYEPAKQLIIAWVNGHFIVLWFSETEQGKAFIASIWSLVLVESWWLLVWNRNIPGLELSIRCSGRCVSSCIVAVSSVSVGFVPRASLVCSERRWETVSAGFVPRASLVAQSVVGRQSLLGLCREFP
ncbi:hypothetical protein F2Q68_00006670 [Brassica cretica]|uniref:Uncharacterized protein n=1 Tax=Brassica cretica TaxID=69181 RepID=A0A8S9J523_BRACR|nr:hypothetical protein F2Q68_00006670 [Brassica cretica]